VVSPPRPTLVVWSRLLGAADLGLGVEGPAFGGVVQAGFLAAKGLRVGVGAQAETVQRFQVEGVAEQLQPAQRDADVFASLLWIPAGRVAPLVALRTGVTLKTVYEHRRRDGEWTWAEVVTDEGDDLAPLPFLGAEAGVSLPLGASLHLEPYAHLQVSLLQGAAEVQITDEVVLPGLPRWSGHLGLALRLEPGS
jgi:hypothetical protein